MNRITIIERSKAGSSKPAPSAPKAMLSRPGDMKKIMPSIWRPGSRFWILLPVAVLAACGLTACGSSAPPSAVSVLKSDGYSSVLNETQAVIKSSFGPAAPYITSAAAGEKGANAVEEVAVGGNTVDGVNGTTFFAALQSGLRAEFPSAKVSVTGDILQITALSLSDITGGKS